MEKIVIYTPYITLGQLLKITNLISSGGEAKYFLSQKKVLVNNVEDNRRGRKLYPNDIVKVCGKEFLINDK